MNSDSEGKSEIISNPKDADVLFGRGPHLRQFPGNIYFRKLIQEYSGEYQNSEDFGGKECACWSVVQSIENVGGRFLSAIEDKEKKNCKKPHETSTETWKEASQRKVLRKIKQAFRDHVNIHKRKQKTAMSTLAARSEKAVNLAASSEPAQKLNFERAFRATIPMPERYSVADTKPFSSDTNDPQTIAQSLMFLERLKAENQRLALEIEDILHQGNSRGRLPAERHLFGRESPSIYE